MPDEIVRGLIALGCSIGITALHRTISDGIYKIALRGERESHMPRWGALPVTRRNADIIAWVMTGLAYLIAIGYLAAGTAKVWT
jgi:hypothetical protein